MNTNPRTERKWWLPWHWTKREWFAVVFLAIVVAILNLLVFIDWLNQNSQPPLFGQRLTAVFYQTANRKT